MHKRRAVSNPQEGPLAKRIKLDSSRMRVLSRADWRKRKEEARALPQLFSQPNQYGFPDKLVTRLRYTDTVTLTGTAGALAGNIFSANSIFDPDRSGKAMSILHAAYMTRMLQEWVINHYTMINMQRYMDIIAYWAVRLQPVSVQA